MRLKLAIHIDYDWIVVQQHLNYVVAVSPFS